MSEHRGTLYTYSGKIAFPGGAPSLLDTAISLSREGRFAGAGQRFFPVALHCFVVADLLPDRLKWDGLMHDNPEVITGDTPKPAKTDEIEAFEVELSHAAYKHHNVTIPNYEEHRLIKEADRKAMRGEVYTVGNIWLQEFYEPCPEAEELIFHYVKEYTYEDMLEASGRVPMEFMRRFRKYKSQLDPNRLVTT
jgi:5'-deoxynucleotidase YfbR-like HD superfamily hydrolase